MLNWFYISLPIAIENKVKKFVHEWSILNLTLQVVNHLFTRLKMTSNYFCLLLSRQKMWGDIILDTIFFTCIDVFVIRLPLSHMTEISN